MRRTPPSISFNSSSVNLVQKYAKPLFAIEMDTTARMRACYNDLPLTFIHRPLYERFQWDDRRVFDLGLRRIQYGTSKLTWVMMHLIWILFFILFFDIIYIIFYLPYYNEFPKHLQSEHGKEWSKKNYGAEVHYADGKFARPFFYLHPPMFTMTVDEL